MRFQYFEVLLLSGRAITGGFMGNKTSEKDFEDAQQNTSRTASYLRTEHPQYDRKELSKASPKSLLKLMDAVKEGDAPRYEIIALLEKVGRMAPGETERLLRQYNKYSIEEFGDFIYRTRSEKAMRDLTYVVVGILKTMVLRDYLRK